MELAQTVPGRIRNFHPLVHQTKAQVFRRPDVYGRLHAGASGLDISVSPAQLDRAYRIMDVLIKTLEQHGMAVSLSKEAWLGSTGVSIDSETVHFGVDEPVKQIPARTPQPYGHKYEFIPQGQLVLRIRESFLGCRTKWSEGKRGQLEDKLPSFIEGLRAAAECLKENRREREAWQEQRERAQRQQRALEEDQQQRQVLEAQALAWQRGRLIRAFVRVRIKQQGPYESDSEFGRWVIWALAHADQLDPSRKLADEGQAP